MTAFLHSVLVWTIPGTVVGPLRNDYFAVFRSESYRSDGVVTFLHNPNAVAACVNLMLLSS